MTQENQNEYKGYSLFNDIGDVNLRARNRAVVLSNIAEEYTNKEKRISSKGASLILNYFLLIPQEERNSTKERFAETMLQRGYILAA